MNKIYNTFLYGSVKTKFKLGTMAAGLLLGAGALGIGILLGALPVLFSSIVLLICDGGFIAGTNFKKLAIQAEERKARLEGEKRLSLDGSVQSVSSEKNSSRKSKKKKSKAKDKDRSEEKIKVSKSSHHKSGTVPEDEDEIPANTREAKERKERINDFRERIDENRLNRFGSRISGVPESRRRNRIHSESYGEEVPSEKKQKEEHINPLLQYDEKRLKKLLSEYKVRKDHVLVLVDSCQKENINECPAVLWSDMTFAFLLLLEKEPRMIKFNLYDHNELHIKVGAQAHPSKDYRDFKEPSFLARVYTPFLPNITESEDPKTGKTVYRKVLYGIGPDIFCTSNSVKNILKALSLNVVLTESKINRETYGDYFKRIYISRLMYRDHIFSAEEYKEKVMGILSNMAERATDDEFLDNVTQMVLGGLIPQDYADYATYKRKKS